MNNQAFDRPFPSDMAAFKALPLKEQDALIRQATAAARVAYKLGLSVNTLGRMVAAGEMPEVPDTSLSPAELAWLEHQVEVSRV